MRTLLDSATADRPPRRTALVAAELDRYNIDVAALCETRLADEGSLTEVGGGYTFFWKGLPSGQRLVHGVGFAIRTTLLQRLTETPVAVNERLITFRVPLIKGRYTTVICVYAPTLPSDDATKDAFYDSLSVTLRAVPRSDKVILLGDFNARVGANYRTWGGIIGRHGVGKANSNGIRLLNLCSEFDLVITNTLFQQKNRYKTTWMHPRSKHWHLLDYVIVRRSDQRDVSITRAMRGAECWTDHRLVRSTMQLRIRPPARKQKPMKRLNVQACKDPATVEALQRCIEEKLQEVPEAPADTPRDTATLTHDWTTFCNSLQEASEAVLGFKSKKHQDWFDDNNTHIHALLHERNLAYAATLRNPDSPDARDKWKELRSRVQRELRQMENNWWIEKARQMQHLADTNETQKFYDAVKTAFGPTHHPVNPIKAKDGTTLIKDHPGILKRWSEHLSELLNHINPTDRTIIDQLPQLPDIPDLNHTPSLHEVSHAVKGLKNNKAAGPDGIPAEIYKHGGQYMLHRLHQFIASVWTSKQLPQQWKDANIVTIFKRKGDKTLCDNYRGISLLSVAGKVLARVMLYRLLNHVVDVVVPESQCGFRRQRSTTDMIFVARLLQEKCREQHRDLFLAFIDLTKAFDTVNRDLLWDVLAKFGCPAHFLSVLQAFHEGMVARVVMGGHLSDPFLVNVGVKQGCVLAPVIFNLFLVAVTLVFRHGVCTDDGIAIKHRLDGNLFNTRRLQAQTKVDVDHIYELQYADDAALPSHTLQGLQRNTDIITETYRRVGLNVSVKKTEMLVQDLHRPSGVHPSLIVNGTALSTVEQFTYLGSTLTANCNLSAEIQTRIRLASAAFGRLSRRVFYNRNLTIATKTAVYNAICISILLYGCESWTPYREHIKALESFHIKCLQGIQGIRWWHKVTHNEIRRRSNVDPIEVTLAQRQLRWVGHVIRMPSHRLPRRLLYGELLDGSRPPGGPKKRFSDHIKTTLKKCHISPSDLEALATDRDIWSVTCESGLHTFAQDLTAAADARRQRRHLTAASASSGPQCTICARVCASAFGLRSHLRVHNRPQT